MCVFDAGSVTIDCAALVGHVYLFMFDRVELNWKRFSVSFLVNVEHVIAVFSFPFVPQLISFYVFIIFSCAD